MFTRKKIAVVSVINDLVTDNRVNKTCQALLESNYEVILIGRKLPNSLPLPSWPFKAKRLNLLFRKGPFFYLFFNLRLFFKLLFIKADLLFANDLDTLLPNFIVSKIKRVPLIYDSHELFCEVPELQHSKIKKQIWLFLESRILPKLKYCITVNQSIANSFEEKYKVRFHVVRNISDTISGFVPKSKQELDLPVNKNIILLQGAGINIHRGAEELIDAMQFVENTLLLIIGSGDVWDILKKKAKTQKLDNKIKLIYRIPKLELMHYTFNANLGISIDKPTNLNYYYSLPNKIFDYLQAQLPILASRLPEIEYLITKYNVGEFIENHEPMLIANRINELFASGKLDTYKKNTVKACEELTWLNEKSKLLQVIKTATSL